jgi:putative membrane protein
MCTFRAVNIPQMNQKPGLLTRLVVSSLAVFVADWLLPGVTIDSFSTAIGVAIVLGILNATLKPLLIIITIPLTFLSLGLFLLIINAIIIGVADQWVDGMHVSSTWTAILFSFLISTISSWMYKWGEGR